jgi:hypothetical protein
MQMIDTKKKLFFVVYCFFVQSIVDWFFCFVSGVSIAAKTAHILRLGVTVAQEK